MPDLNRISRMDRLRWLYRAWRYRLLLERQEVRALRRHLTAGDTAIDIGAHKGAFTYWMLRRVGRDGLVLAFEPQRPLAVALRELVVRRRLSQRRGRTDWAFVTVGHDEPDGAAQRNLAQRFAGTRPGRHRVAPGRSGRGRHPGRLPVKAGGRGRALLSSATWRAMSSRFSVAGRTRSRGTTLICSSSVSAATAAAVAWRTCSNFFSA